MLRNRNVCFIYRIDKDNSSEIVFFFVIVSNIFLKKHRKKNFHLVAAAGKFLLSVCSCVFLTFKLNTSKTVEWTVCLDFLVIKV